MASRTVKDAHSTHGTNSQYLSESWKEQCFGLTAELVVCRAMELSFVGGIYGGSIKPTRFLCLTLKMLQIQPEKDITVEFIKNEDFKYVRMLGAFYMRLTGTAVDGYKYLQPLYKDYRKIKSQNRNGGFELMHVDEFIDELLHSERVCDIILLWLQKQEAEQLEPRVSGLEEDMDDVESNEEEKEEDEKLERASSPDHRRRSSGDLDYPGRSPTLRYRRGAESPKRRNPAPCRQRHRSKSPRRHRRRSGDRRHRSRSKSPGHHRSHRHRRYSKSPERSKKSHKKRNE
uniref:Pre-mRNA-splicing factor 38B n=1 Tax=Rhinopithecus roxellana TaxID=61622 RepID=A0A2K6QVC3_RHIRO